MTDQQQAQDAHVSDADDAQDATSQNDSQASAQDATPTGFDALPKETQEEIRALRKENAKYRTRVKEIEDAEKSDLEKLTGERDDFKTRYETLEAKYRASVAESAVKDAATAAGAISAKAVFALIRDDVTFDDDGQPENVAALIEKAQTDEPALFRKAAGRGDGGKGNGTIEPNLKPGLERLQHAYGKLEKAGGR